MMSYKNFKLTEEVDALLAENDRRGIISTLTSTCYLDRNFSTGTFEDGLEYVLEQKQYRQLWEPFRDDPPLFRPRIEAMDPTLCDADYPDSIAYLKLNFCPERVEDTRRLGQYLFPRTSVSRASVSSGPAEGSASRIAQIIAAVAAAAAAVGVVVWILRKLFAR